MCMKLKTFNRDSLQYMLNILLKLYRMYNKTTAISLLGLDANTNIHELISVSSTNRRFALIWSICCLSFRFFLQERTIALNSLSKILFIVGTFFQKTFGSGCWSICHTPYGKGIKVWNEIQKKQYSTVSGWSPR